MPTNDNVKLRSIPGGRRTATTAKEHHDQDFTEYQAEAERRLLGAVLLDPGALDVDVEPLNVGNLGCEAHRKIVRAMLALHERNEPVDLVTLSDELRQRGDLEAVGGSPYLVELAEKVPPGDYDVAFHAVLVRANAVVRRSREERMSRAEARK